MLSIYHFVIHSRSERHFLKEYYAEFSIDEVFTIMQIRNIEYIVTLDYESDESLSFIRKKNPDFLVSHTPFWIGKKVRDMPNEKVTIGSHPGLVPFYRGAHSPFWCIYDEEPEKNGYSIFCLDEGVDSGPLIEQKRIGYRKEISYRLNDYVLMNLISIAQARIAESYSNGNSLMLLPQTDLDPSQIRRAPGIIDYCQFRLFGY